MQCVQHEDRAPSGAPSQPSRLSFEQLEKIHSVPLPKLQALSSSETYIKSTRGRKANIRVGDDSASLQEHPVDLLLLKHRDALSIAQKLVAGQQVLLLICTVAYLPGFLSD